MKKILSIILIISISKFCLSQELEYSVGDTLSIFTKSGLNLRTLPNTESEIITRINLGSKIQISELTDNNETIENRIGNWLRVKYEEKEGYLFSGFLTSLKVNEINIENIQCYEDLVFLDWVESIVNKEELIKSGEKKYGYSDVDYKSGETIIWNFYSKGTVVTYNYGYENYCYTVETFEITMNDCLNFLDYYIDLSNSKCLGDSNYRKPKIEIKKNQYGGVEKITCEELGYLCISGNRRLVISLNVITS